jgi:endonuclease/exonuclease/phosphatase family metal-dependent hydrolase
VAGRARADPVIVTGDLNAGEGSAPLRRLTGVSPGGAVRLIDSFRVAHPRAGDVGTFGGFEGRRGGAKLDYVFVLPGTLVLDAAILRDNSDGRYPSDHYPVTAHLLFPAPAAATAPATAPAAQRLGLAGVRGGI